MAIQALIYTLHVIITIQQLTTTQRASKKCHCIHLPSLSIRVAVRRDDLCENGPKRNTEANIKAMHQKQNPKVIVLG